MFNLFIKSKSPVILKYEIGYFKEYSDISKDFKTFLWSFGYEKCIYSDNPNKIDTTFPKTFILHPITYELAIKANEEHIKVIEFVWQLLIKDKDKSEYKNFASDSYSDYLDRLSESTKNLDNEFFTDLIKYFKILYNSLYNVYRCSA